LDAVACSAVFWVGQIAHVAPACQCVVCAEVRIVFLKSILSMLNRAVGDGDAPHVTRCSARQPLAQLSVPPVRLEDRTEDDKVALSIGVAMVPPARQVRRASRVREAEQPAAAPPENAHGLAHALALVTGVRL